MAPVLHTTLQRLRRDARGSTSVVFGLALVPAMIGVGAAIDYSRFNDAKSTVQTAADATALALTKTLTATSTGPGLQTIAQTKLSTYSQNQAISLTAGPTLSQNNTQLCLTASTTVNATLAAVFHPGATTVSATSCAAAAGSGTYEIALVLDNTGSMSESSSGKTKLASAQAAATALIAQLNPTGQTANASFSVVPFATSVNVGTVYANASWLDTTGASSIAWQNYTRPAKAAWLPTSRFDMFTQMGASWAGCIEERPDPYLITDTSASSATPDTLFEPYLWPDEGDVPGNGSATLPSTGKGWQFQFAYKASNWSSYSNGPMNNYIYDFDGSCVSSLTDPYVLADVADPTSRGSGATKLCKYKAPGGISSNVGSYGPNYACIATPLMPLTQDASALNKRINAMTAGGDTNLLPGFMWGWRAISPNGPFANSSSNQDGTYTLTGSTTTYRTPKAYNATNNTKVIVFMTDGFNNWQSNSDYAYKSEYNALGYYTDNRLSAYGGSTYPGPQGQTSYSGSTDSTNWRYQMDAALLAACTNAKNAGVVIYTVGFSIPSDPIDTEGIKLLQKCASSSANAFVATDGTGLLSAFQQIGTGLGNLRIKS